MVRPIGRILTLGVRPIPTSIGRVEKSKSLAHHGMCWWPLYQLRYGVIGASRSFELRDKILQIRLPV